MRFDAYACGHHRSRHSHGDRGRPCRPAPDHHGHYVWNISIFLGDFRFAGLKGGLPAVRRSRAIASVTAVTVIITITLATVILARRVVASASGAGSPAARRTRRAAVAVAARIEAPGRRRRSAGPL